MVKKNIRYITTSFILMIFIMYVGIAAAETAYITNMNDVISSDPNSNDCCGTQVYVATAPGATDEYYTYIQIPVNIPQLNMKLHFLSTTKSASYNPVVKIYNTGAFSEDTITWNTKPALGTLITSFTINSSNTWYEVPVSSSSQYIVLMITPTGNTEWSKIYQDEAPQNQAPYFTYDPSLFDPSGYVKDVNGNGVFNAKVQLSNNTWSDACITSCYSDSTGFWSTNIFANGTYNYTVSKSGYTPLSGSQAFTIGGTNQNFTITSTLGVISGHVYTTANSSGSIPIKGDVDILKKQFTQLSISSGSTLSLLGSPDGNTYVIKLIDVDSPNQQAVIDIMKNGVVLFDNQLLDANQQYMYKIIEDNTEITYIDVMVTNIFSGGESGRITVNAGYTTQKKIGISFLEFLNYLAFQPTGSGAWFSVLQLLLNWNSFTTDGTNTNSVTFNASSGNDVIGSQVFDIGTSNIYNFYVLLDAESASQYSGKVLLGYTDDIILSSPCDTNSCTDDLLINTRRIYSGGIHDFKSLDTNNNGKIRVWFTFKSGYSSFRFYEFYINALGATTRQPLSGANIYYSATLNTLSDALGAYHLNVPLDTDLILVYKLGYESKNVTHIFNVSNPTFVQDIILNSTTKTTNSTSEYIRVDPNPITIGTQAYAYYKTLDKTNPLLLGYGGYQIAVCTLLGNGECEKYDVAANIESSIPLNSYGVGAYTIQLTGFSGGFSDFGRDIIASSNFTVISSTPSINWGTGTYYLGEKMVLSIYIPSSSSIVNVSYPNGSALYGNSYSASTIIYNISFQTDTNMSFPSGIYTATINGGSPVVTQLLNQSASSYRLTAPVSIKWGDILNVDFISPRASTLIITNQNNNILVSRDVSGTKTLTFDTKLIPNEQNILTTKLVRDTNVLAISNTTVTLISTQPNLQDKTGELLNSNYFVIIVTLIAFATIGFYIGGLFSSIVGFSAGYIVLGVLGLMPLWAIFLFAISVIVILAIMLGGKITGGAGD